MSGLVCQFCDGQHPVTVLMTWFPNGASVSTCAEDLAPALIHILATDLGVEPGGLYDSIRKYVDRQAKKQASEAGSDTSGDGSPNGASANGESTYDDGGTADDQGGASEAYGKGPLGSEAGQ